MTIPTVFAALVALASLRTSPGSGTCRSPIWSADRWLSFRIRREQSSTS